MKKNLFLLFLFFPNFVSAFDFESAVEKEKFCAEKMHEYIESIGYNPETDSCIFQRDGVPTPDEEDAKDLYCQNKYEQQSRYSYVRNACIGKDDIFLEGEIKIPKEFFEVPENYFPKFSTSLENYFFELMGAEDTFFKNIAVSKVHQRKLTPIFKKIQNLFANISEKEAEKIGKNLEKLLDKKIKNTKNQNLKNIFSLLKYEVKNLYLKKIYGCKGNFCAQNVWKKYQQGFRKILKLKNNIELQLKSGFEMATFGCYDGKTILKKDGKEKIIIDDEKVKIWDYRNICAVDAQVVDDDNVWLFVCIANGGWSGDCGALVFNLNLDTEKLSFIGNWYKTYESSFNLLALKYADEYRKKQEEENKEDVKKIFEDMRKSPEELTQRRNENIKWFLKYLLEMRENNKKIRKYFKEAHNLEIDFIEGDDYIKLLDEYEKMPSFQKYIKKQGL